MTRRRAQVNVMLHEAIKNKSTIVDPNLVAGELWEAIQRLAADWHDAARIEDVERATRTEQHFRSFALVFASLPVDGKAVTTGHKAIVRAICTKLGTVDTLAVLAVLDAVIGHEEEEEARRGT